MKRLGVLLALGSAGLASAQSPNVTPVRIPVRHADPWAVKAMLEGLPIRSPEMSSLPGFQGLGQAAGAGISGFLSAGRLVVNVTDNSLWYFPNRS